MTIVEIQNQLHSFFLKSDTFVYPDDVKNIKLGKNQLSASKEIIKTVLDNFKENKMLFCSHVSGEKEKIYYTLFAPVGMEGQEIQVSQHTAEVVAEIVNQFNEAHGIKDMVVDKLQINDHDIQYLAMICTQLMGALDKQEDESNDDE